MPCGLAPKKNVRTTVIVCQFTSSTVPPSRVATYTRSPFGCFRRWCDVAGKASEPVTVLVPRSTLNNWFAFVVTKRSEEHTSELQSPCNLVCRLLLEKKKKKYNRQHKTNVHVPTQLPRHQ